MNQSGYLVFDIETILDGDLLASTKYDGETAEEAINHAKADALLASNNASDFVNVAYHIPVCIGLASLSQDFEVKSITAFSGECSKIVLKFWQYYHVSQPTIITFNGRGFDLPVLELMAFKHSIRILPESYWGRTGPRNRYSESHIDLLDFLCNYGASRLSGGLDLLVQQIGLDGKTLDGKAIDQLYREDKHKDIEEYCINDVYLTYAVFLRTRLMLGEITSGEQETKLLQSFEIKNGSRSKNKKVASESRCPVG